MTTQSNSDLGAKVNDYLGRVKVKKMTSRNESKEQWLVTCAGVPICFKVWRLEKDEIGYFRVDVCKFVRHETHSVPEAGFYVRYNQNGQPCDKSDKAVENPMLAMAAMGLFVEAHFGAIAKQEFADAPVDEDGESVGNVAPAKATLEVQQSA